MKVRLCLAAMLAVLGLAAAAPSASAAGGQYRVVKCHPWHIEADEVEHAGGHPSYWTVNDCRGTALDPKLGIFNAGAAGNTAYEQFMFSAPPGTHIETACLDHKLRRDGHHRAELLAFPGFRVLATGGDAAGGWVSQCFDLSHSQVILRLACEPAPAGAPAGPNAHAYVRNVVLALVDDADPVITAFGGDILGGGWVRGSRTLAADAVDCGAGVFHVVGFVNGVEVGRQPGRMQHGWTRVELHAACSDRAAVRSRRAQPAAQHGDAVRSSTARIRSPRTSLTTAPISIARRGSSTSTTPARKRPSAGRSRRTTRS